MAYVAPTELGNFENIFLRIPVYMHNVAAERVFRPSAWAAFGTADLESADYRACANFGPLYA